MSALLKKTPNADEFGAALIEYSEQHLRSGSTRLRIVLDRLQAYTQDIHIDHIPVIVNSFYNFGDLLLKKEDEPRGFFEIDTQMEIMRIIYQLISRLPQDQRFLIIRSAIVNGKAISLIDREVAVLGQEHGKFGGEVRKPEHDRVVNAEQLKELEGIALEKIRNAAKDGALFNAPNLRSILSGWREWSGNDHEMRAWVSKTIGSDENLAKFVYYFGDVQRSQTFGEVALRERYRLDPEWIKPFAVPEALYPRIQNILKQDDIPDEYRMALEQFCKEYEIRQRGENPDERH
jgi:predicted KAP-like P-loop ATPase